VKSRIPRFGLPLAVLLVSFATTPIALAQTAPRPAAPASGLARLSEDLQALAERVRPSIVQVLVTGYAPAREGGALLSSQRGGGSGVILHPDGYVVTNAHVIAGARHIDVVVPPPTGPPGGGRSVLKASGRIVGAQVVGIDRETDLAVLLLPEKGLPALSLGDSEAVRPGQLVVAFGSPLGLEGSVSLGVVSATARQLEPESPMIYLQTDASINPGNSGGPLLDTEGRVVGINTLILSQSGGSEGIGFAAPSNVVRNVFEQIRQSGRVQRGEIGAHAQTITAEVASGLGLAQTWGVVIADVTPGGPAAEAGLHIGDLVLSMDGKLMENARQFDVNLYRRPVGVSVPLEVQRGERRLTLRVKVRERPRDAGRLAELVSRERNLVAALGILAIDLSDARLAALLGPLRAQAGVVVAAARGDALPWEDTLQPGDVIYALNGQSVMDIDGLRAALGGLGGKRSAVLQVERGGVLRYVAVPVE
jgi:serine protease Do